MTSCLALIAASLSIAGICGISQWLSPKADGISRFGINFLVLFGICEILSFRIWWNAPWIVGLTWLLIATGVLKTFMTASKDGLSLKQINKSPHKNYLTLLFAIMIGLCLVIEALWAALPLYRYDQWTYHLVVAKWVDLIGTLTGPMTSDHIFFTGTYEYLGLLPRLLWRNDAFQQGFQNSFTSLWIAYTAAGCVCANRKLTLSGVTIAFAFALAVIFGAGDHEALSSAKPDFILMSLAFIIIAIMTDTDTRTRDKSLLIGALIAAGVSFKITWIHFAFAITPVAAFLSWRNGRLKSIARLAAGAAAGIILSSTYLIKNYLIFGNPLHPGQSPLWSSNIWNAELDAYWKSVSQRPAGLYEFFRVFMITIAEIPVRFWIPLLSAVLFAAADRLHSNDQQPRTIHRAGFAVIFAVTILYSFFWGIFYGPDVGQRFVSPQSGIIMSAMFLLVRARGSSTTWHAAALLIPFLVIGQFEVTIQKIAASIGHNTAEFEASFPKSIPANNAALREIGQHRTSIFGPSVRYDQAVMISDYNINFYGPSLFYESLTPLTKIHLKSQGIDPDTGCAAAFFKARDIRYVWDFGTGAWPGAITRVFPKMERLTISKGTLYYVPDFDQLTCA